MFSCMVRIFDQVPQCGKFRIFLLLLFYVKSILDNLEVLKMPFLLYFASEFCLFGFQPSKNVKTNENEKSEPLNMLK